LAPRRNALDAACQSVKGFFVVKRTVEALPTWCLEENPADRSLLARSPPGKITGSTRSLPWDRRGDD
jgi:hypothetical protein